jgi:arylsulfatase A-like enzyme
LTRYHLYTPKTVRKWKCRSDPTLGILIIRKGNKSNDYDEGFYSTEYYADNLLRYLRDRPGAAKSKKRDDENLDEDEPFFAFLPFSAPHWPLQCDKVDRDNYKGVYDEGPGVLREKRLAKLKELGKTSSRMMSLWMLLPNGRNRMQKRGSSLLELWNVMRVW